MINWLLHHLLHVTFITHHKIKELLNKNYSRGNFIYWTGFVQKLLLGDNFWGIYWPHFPLACEESNNWPRMFQPNINDHKPDLVVSQALASAEISSQYEFL